MKYKLLNEVLIEWNKSSKEDSDNVLLKSEDIKRSLNKCFIYKLKKGDNFLVIFHIDQGKHLQYPWLDFEKYKDKVWINNKHVKLDNRGWTVDEFEPGEYRVYIEDIDKITNTDSMFWECNQLVSAVLPTGVETIGKYTFGKCSFLQNVFIPNSVKIIDNGAFSYCSSLTSVTIPNSVTTINPYAFWNCSGLMSVRVPDSVTFIRTGVFAGCSNLKTVYVEDINKFNRIEFEGVYSDPRYYGAKVIELKK